MYTKLFRTIPVQHIPTPSARPIMTRPIVRPNSPDMDKLYRKAAELEYAEQNKYEQEFSTYNKIKMEMEAQSTDANKKGETMTPKEAAGKILDAAFVKLRAHLGTYGDSLNLIEHPLRTYAFPKFEKIFTYFAKDGRVDKQTVDRFSGYALLFIVALAVMLVAEKVTNQKEKIAKIEKELDALDKQYANGVLDHGDIRHEIKNKQEKLRELQEALEKYENILVKLEESQHQIFLKSKDQSILRQLVNQFLSFGVNPEKQQKEEIQSYLNEQKDDVAAKLTAREITKWGSVNAVAINAEDKISQISKKEEKIKGEIEKAELSATRVAQYVIETGDKLENKQMELKNTWGYSFFSQYAKKIEEESAPTNTPATGYDI
ncbi:TPA: hypothetical protein ACX87D_001127 [Legionella pneumophila]